MKNTNKKGFTLVELVIVIAVIAILAAVLIPTFTAVITRANQSAAVQKIKAVIDEEYVEYVADKQKVPTTLYIKDGVFSFTAIDGATSYLLVKTETPDPYTKSCVKLDSKYDVYLLWDAENGYSIKVLESVPSGYQDLTTS